MERDMYVRNLETALVEWKQAASSQSDKIIDLQRTLDAEREKVKELEADLVSIKKSLAEGAALIATLQAQLADSEKAYQDKARLLIEQTGSVAALQAQLAECYRLSGADPDGNEDWRLAEHAVAEVKRLREESDKELDCKDTLIEQLYAQLRQVGEELANERTAYKKLSEQWNKDNIDLTALRQLVEALPVIEDIKLWQDVNEHAAPRYWMNGIMFYQKDSRDSYAALLRYRATLAAQDAGNGAENGR